MNNTIKRGEPNSTPACRASVRARPGLRAAALLLSATALLAAAANAGAQTAYAFFDLGGTPANQTDPFGINDVGQVVGATRIVWGVFPASQAVLWNSGTTPPVPLSITGQTYNSAAGINHSGQIVGGSYSMNAERNDFTTGVAVVWNGGTPTILPVPGATFSRAWAINSSGTVAGESDSYALLWNSSTGAATNLGVGVAYAINDLGQAVGTNGGAVSWDAVSLQPSILPAVTPGAYSSAAGVNNSGQVVGYGTGVGGIENLHALVWNNFVPTDLTPGLNNESSARGINNAGQIVGTIAWQRAMLWTGSGSNYVGTDLNSVLDTATAATWTLTEAVAINDNGWIIGVGDSSTLGSNRAFLLAPVPEPGTWVLMLAGLGVLGFVARRRAA